MRWVSPRRWTTRSGVSFTDLAADRAGTLFGQAATRSEESAARTLAYVLATGSESGILPEIRDLPEGMNAGEFERRYGAVDSEAYRAVTARIEERLARIPLYPAY